MRELNTWLCQAVSISGQAQKRWAYHSREGFNRYYRFAMELWAGEGEGYDNYMSFVNAGPSIRYCIYCRQFKNNLGDCACSNIPHPDTKSLEASEPS